MEECKKIDNIFGVSIKMQARRMFINTGLKGVYFSIYEKNKQENEMKPLYHRFITLNEIIHSIPCRYIKTYPCEFV